MAKPIKDTPTLHGKDAKRFMQSMVRAESSIVTPARIAQIREAMQQIPFADSATSQRQSTAAKR